MTLQEENIQLKIKIAELEVQLAQALEQLAKVANQKEVPTWVRPNKTKTQAKKTRRKRASEHNQARSLDEPTQTVEIKPVGCEDCGVV